MIPKYKLLILFAILLASGCRKDIDQFIPLPQETGPELVSASVLGRVRSLDGASIGGAQVLMNGQIVSSDGSGFYYLKDAPGPRMEAVLEVRKNGFFPSFRRLPWTVNGEFHADFWLASKSLAGAVANETGGEVTLPQGFWLEIPPMGLEYENGEPFTGTARVYAHWMDPTDPVFSQLAPAGSHGLDLEDNPRHLTSFGILALELTDDNGLALRTVPGKNIDLHFPVPVSLAGIAPAELTLWSFDREEGLWKEESSASLLGQYYHAKAVSGPFWNVASSSPLVQVKGWVQLNDGSPAREVRIEATGTGGSLLAAGQTQNQGMFVLELPGNTPITLHVLESCGNEATSQSLPSLSGNVSLNPILLDSGDMVQVKGRLLDCDEIPVAQGYIHVIAGEQESFLPLKDGAFSAFLPGCPEDVVTLIGFDLVRNYQTLPMNFSPAEPVDAGDWVLCNDAPEYISFNLGGEVYFSDVPDLEINGPVTTISEPALGVSLSFEGTAPGVFPVLNQGFSLDGFSAANTSALDLMISVSRFDPPGGYVIGSFNGKVADLGGDEHQVSGVFKLQRN